MGLKRWPLKPDTTFVLPSPAGPAGCCPWDWVVIGWIISLGFLGL